MSRYRRVRIVGKGSFGCCWLVENGSGEQCILKEIDVSKMPAKQRDEAANEVKVLSKLRHPFVIAFRESYMSDGLLCIITDYAEKGDLYRVIHRQKRSSQLLSEAHVLRWFTQTALALKHLHDRHIVHRDLKTQNIFLSGPGCGTVKMGDFGIARVLQHTQDCARTAIGTPYYLSPEICQEKPYNHKSDIWSLGCVLYELATLHHAFDADSMRGLVMKILRGVPPQVPLTYSAALRALVPELLTKDPRSRPSISEVLRRPVMRGMIRQLLQEVETSLRARRSSGAGGAEAGVHSGKSSGGGATTEARAAVAGGATHSASRHAASDKLAGHEASEQFQPTAVQRRAGAPPGGLAGHARLPQAAALGDGHRQPERKQELGGTPPRPSAGQARPRQPAAPSDGSQPERKHGREPTQLRQHLRVHRSSLDAIAEAAGSSGEQQQPSPTAEGPAAEEPHATCGEEHAGQDCSRDAAAQRASERRLQDRPPALLARQPSGSHAEPQPRPQPPQRQQQQGRHALQLQHAQQGLPSLRAGEKDVDETVVMGAAGPEGHAWPRGQDVSGWSSQSTGEAISKAAEEDGRRNRADAGGRPAGARDAPPAVGLREAHRVDEAGRGTARAAEPPSPGRHPRPAEGASEDAEDLELISTLRDGLHLEVCEPGKEDAGGLPSPHAAAGAHFVSLDGQILDLPVSEKDSLSYRIEALRVHLEQEVGLEDFLFVYRYLNESAQAEGAAQGGAPAGLQLEANVSARAIGFLPLVHQLIVCEDRCFGN